VPADARRAAATLRFRSVRLVFLRLRRPQVTPCASLYLPDPALCVARVSEPKNRSIDLAPVDETGLVAEVPCFPDDAIMHVSDDALIARVRDELAHVGLVSPDWVADARHHLLPNAYPVYHVGWSRAVATVLNATRVIDNLDVLGRGGLFYYSHLHDQLRLAREYIDQQAPRSDADALQVS
jgi:protoporphyrinogen oxidase